MLQFNGVQRHPLSLPSFLKILQIWREEEVPVAVADFHHVVLSRIDAKLNAHNIFLIPPYSLTQHAFFPKLVWTSWYLKGWKILPSQFSFGFYRSRNSRQHVKMAQNQVRKARDKNCTDTDHRWGSWGEALRLIFIAWFLNFCTHKMQYHHMQYVAENASWVQWVVLLPKKWVIPSGLVLDWGYKVKVINIPLVHKKFTL